jgi:hypothetical protein
MTAIIIVSSPLGLYATTSGIGFYSPDSPPPGVKSLEDLIGDWWNKRVAQDPKTANSWPECFKEEGGMIGNNQSVVFVGDPVTALPVNKNATNQRCEISSDQLLYLTVYAGECSTGSRPGEGEYPDTKSPAALLDCAKDSNKELILKQVKVDGKDVSSNIVRQTTAQPFNWNVSKDNVFEWPAPIAGGNNTSMAENYYLFFKPMPLGDHTIDLHVIKDPPGGTQPVQDLVAKWYFKVVP